MLALNTIVLAVAAFAASAVARGSGHHAPGKGSITVSQALSQCSGNNNGQAQVSCCSEKTTDGLLSILDDVSVLGGACQPILLPVNILGGGGGNNPITEYCNNRVACCGGDTSGSPCTLVG